MNRRSEDAGEVPWPALVDLLTSVLITFMFFILVTTVAMSAMTMKTAVDQSKNRQEAQKVSQTEVVSNTESVHAASVAKDPTAMPSNTLLPPPGGSVASEDPVSRDESERLKAENELLKQQLAAMGATFAKSKEIKTVAEPKDNALTLLFNPNEAGMLPAVEDSIARFIKAMQGQIGNGMKIELTASEPDGVSFSQGRERALTRAMVVRNVLLEKDFDPDAIVFRYDSGKRFESHNWVRLQAVEKDAKDGN